MGTATIEEQVVARAEIKPGMLVVDRSVQYTHVFPGYGFVLPPDAFVALAERKKGPWPELIYDCDKWGSIPCDLSRVRSPEEVLGNGYHGIFFFGEIVLRGFTSGSPTRVLGYEIRQDMQQTPLDIRDIPLIRSIRTDTIREVGMEPQVSCGLDHDLDVLWHFFQGTFEGKEVGSLELQRTSPGNAEPIVEMLRYAGFRDGELPAHNYSRE